MALDFPDSPAADATWTSPIGVTYTWDGTKWTASVSGGGPALVEPVGAGTWGRLETGAWQRSVALSGDGMTGGLTISQYTSIVAPAASDASLSLVRPIGQSANLAGYSTDFTLPRWVLTTACWQAWPGTDGCPTNPPVPSTPQGWSAPVPPDR